MTALALNPTPRIDIHTFGQDNQVLVVEDALANPEDLLASAHRDSFGAPPPNSWYPGLVATLPDTYLNLLLRELRRPMAKVFDMPPDQRSAYYGFFGLATVRPDQMAPNQVAPHTDTSRLHSFATVHYLSQDHPGGTSFYRHKSTGLELITPSVSAKFAFFRRQELAQCEGQPLSAVEDLYEEIFHIEPKFNRLILYRAGQIHRSKLKPGAALSSDPATGRLTANTFFNTE
ncbi:hypothetical protein ABAC460_06595 [Asticcacaulis sp. AC460]|uniref:DUF6445 family protein n=1 Tax=Asticcacaulis sp. AC460 TaxID=1282360 RepID=UPI0003C3EF62|nr:DUF6445 family protein [Asticcacaulis sp. AC460]ESQ91227.1 hypothetical protein ABAC460_06595 [Asticcacaulis sp. AC460]